MVSILINNYIIACLWPRLLSAAILAKRPKPPHLSHRVQMPVMLTVQSSSLDFAYIRAIQLQQADVDRPDLHAHWRGSTMSGM